MRGMKNSAGKPVLQKMIAVIQRNKDYISEVDGLIADGDHGVNMNKGFTIFGEQIKDRDISFTDGLKELGDLLFTRIGGSMGPIYGTIFSGMAEIGEKHEVIDAAVLSAMLDHGVKELHDVVPGEVGDKTLVDALAPANDALQKAVKEGKDLASALKAMKDAAEAGRDATRDMISKFGRSSRLGERSRGVMDAGAVSCCFLLHAMADGILELAD
jgi:dihydroxyacetone kinase-like protein